MWQLRKTPEGEIRFIPIEEKEPKAPKGGTIHATLTSKLMRDGVDKVISSAAEAGGSTPVVRGKLVSIEVDGENVESVGEVFESFGCQWDLY